MIHQTPKKLVVLATHGDGEPPKTLNARYVDSFVMGSNAYVALLCSGAMLEI